MGCRYVARRLASWTSRRPSRPINAALGTPEDLATARRIVSFLERNFEGGSARIKELVAVSFLENLPRDDQQGHEVWELLGPELAAEAARLA